MGMEKSRNVKHREKFMEFYFVSGVNIPPYITKDLFKERWIFTAFFLLGV